MNLGRCAGCKNTNELHEGTDGRGYCEDCLAKNAKLDPMSRHAERPQQSKPSGGDKRQDYLEFIIAHVTDEWIDKFLNDWKDEMKRSYRWVQELRGIEDELVLLRLASELGFGKTMLHQASYATDKVRKDIKEALEEVNSDINVGVEFVDADAAKYTRGTGKAKSNTSRGKAKTRS